MAWAVEDTEGLLTQGSIVTNVEWHTGENQPLGIVLTNPCDFENDKASFILIAALVEASEVIKASKDFKNIIGETGEFHLSKSKSKSLRDLISRYIHNINIARYFFIDPSQAFDSPHLFVDFQRTITIPFDPNLNLEIVGILESPFREKMVIHFASYSSRIGVDRVDINKSEIISQALVKPYILN